jgi:hypothetical protein
MARRKKGSAVGAGLLEGSEQTEGSGQGVEHQKPDCP